MGQQQADAKVVLSAQDSSGGAFASFLNRMTGLTAPLDNLKGKLLGAFPTTALERLKNGVGGLNGKLAAIGIGGGVALGGLALVKSGFDAIVDTAEKADRVSDLGGRLRLNAEEFQVFDKLAKANGSSVEELGGAVLKFKLNLSQAAADGGPKLAKLTSALAGFGLTYAQAQAMKPIDLLQKIGQVSARSQEDGDELKKIGLYRDVFGKTGATQINVIEALGGSYQKVLQQMRDAGLLMTDEMAQRGGDAFKAYEKSKGAAAGLRLAFGIQMMPVFEQFSKVMESRMKANRTAMMPGVKALAEVLSTNIAPFLADMDKAAEKTSGLFKWVSRLAGLVGWDKLIFAGIALIAAPFVASAGAIVVSLAGVTWGASTAIAAMSTGAFMTALNGLRGLAFALQIVGLTGAQAWLMILGPVALVIGAALLIYAYWDELKVFFGGVWEGLIQGIQPVLTALAPVGVWVGAALGWIGSLFDSTGGKAGEGATSFAAWADAGRVAGAAIAGVLKAILTPMMLVIDAFKLLGDQWDWFNGKDFNFTSSTKALLVGSPAGPEAARAAPEGSTLPATTISTQRTDVSGRIDLRVMADGQVRTERAESNNNGFDFNVNSGGMYGVGA
jgi:hypothetical protein